MVTVAPWRVGFGAGQLQIRLVDQRSGLQGVILALLPHVLSGDFPQFRIDQCGKGGARRRIPLLHIL